MQYKVRFVNFKGKRKNEYIFADDLTAAEKIARNIQGLQQLISIRIVPPGAEDHTTGDGYE